MIVGIIRRLWTACSTSVLIALLLIPATAQTDSAEIYGIAADRKGKLVEDVEIVLIDNERDLRRTARTNRDGFYIFTNVKPGNYRMQASLQGFQAYEVADVRVIVQMALNVNFTMVGGSPSAPLISKTGTLGSNITGAVVTGVDRELVGELPLNGRSFQTLFQLIPGIVIAPTNFASQGQISVNGQRTDANYFVVDGVSANFAIAGGVNPGQSAGGWLPALTVLGGTNSVVSTEAVQEFAVLTSSYSAEFGRVPGGQISIVTRSGTNRLSGSVFEYLRNDAVDANDWFANSERLPRAALRQSDFGGVIGGPIIKDKTFFFASFEGLELRQPTSNSTDVPSLSARNAAPEGVKPFLNAYPVPNGPDEGNGLARATYGFSNPSSLDALSFRVDHRFRESLSAFARYVYSTSDNQQRGAGSNSLSTITDTRFGAQTLTGGLAQFINERTTNDVRFNWSRASAVSNNQLDNFGGAIPLVPNSLFPAGFDQLNSLFQFVPALNQLAPGLGLGQSVANTQEQINLVDDISRKVHGHLIRAGLDFRQLSPTLTPAVYEQQSSFQDIQSAVNDRGLVVALDTSVPVTAIFNNYSVFGQDSWKVSSRLNMTFGVRWDWASTPRVQGANGLRPFPVIGFNDLRGLSLAPQGTQLYLSRMNNLAPRLGFAYVSRGTTGTQSVIKAGAGVYYDLSNGPAGDTLSGFSFPYAAQAFFSGASLPLNPMVASPPVITTNPPFSSLQGFPIVLRTPYSYHWNVSFEQGIGSAQILNIGYAGAAGHRLLRSETYFGGEAGVSTAFTEIIRTDNSGLSSFNSLQVTFNRRAGRTNLIASYCLSHSLDNVSTDETFAGIPARFIDPRRDYGPSDFDIRHTTTVGLDYGVSGFSGLPTVVESFLTGWSVDAILVMRSSPPVNPVISRDIGFGIYDFRPDLIPGVPLYVSDPRSPGGRRVNAGALAVPLMLRQGDLGRNYFRGFPLFQDDFAVRRAFSISHYLPVEVRVEAFNLFNRANFASPASRLGVVDALGNLVPQNGFGISSSTLARGLQGGSFGAGLSPLYQIGGARSIQLSLRISF